ncbi:MAG TPA: acetylglutamate kinase [Elusimicrobia bacterium]|nr:acetylglutamate kinase [Elusimicrobiota bacterium]
MPDAIRALRQALPYVRLYKGKTFVVKIGGRILQKRETLDALIEELCLLHQVGIRIVVVHGGGPQASELSRRLGIEPTIVAGRRVTDEQTLEVAKMVYAGSLNVDMLSVFRAHQTPAVGVSGVDAGLLTARRRHKKRIEPFPGAAPVEVDFGFVGDIVRVDPAILESLLAAGCVPVISPLACDERGTVFNINADSIAEAVARSLAAEKLLILTDTDGVLRDPADPTSLVSLTDIAGLERMREEGKLTGGMLPKVDGAIAALRGGVRRAHILNGTRAGTLLMEIFTNSGSGTMIAERCEAAGVPVEQGAAA